MSHHQGRILPPRMQPEQGQAYRFDSQLRERKGIGEHGKPTTRCIITQIDKKKVSSSEEEKKKNKRKRELQTAANVGRQQPGTMHGCRLALIKAGIVYI